MNALRHSSPASPHPPGSRQPHPPQRRRAIRSQSRRHPHRDVVAETSVKLVVNLMLGFIAATALARLIPYNLTQEDSLQELEMKVGDLEHRVDRLQADLNHNFAPDQSINVVQEQTALADPNQRQIVFLTPDHPAAKRSAPESLPPATAPTDSPIAPDDAIYPAH